MTNLLSLDQQRDLLQRLGQLSAERARAEADAEAGFHSRNQEAETEHREARRRTESLFAAEKETAEKEWQEAQLQIPARFAEEDGQARKEFARTRRRVAAQYESAKEKAKTGFQETRWAIVTIFEEGRKKAKAQYQKTLRLIARKVRDIDSVRQAARQRLQRWSRPASEIDLDVPAGGDKAGDPLHRLDEHIAAADEHLDRLKALTLPVYCTGGRVFWTVVCFWFLAVCPALLVSWWYIWLAAVTIVAIAVGVMVRLWLGVRAKAQIDGAYRPLCQSLADAEAAAVRARDQAKAEYKDQLARNKQRRDDDWRRAERKYRPLLHRLRKRREEGTREADEKYLPLLSQLKEAHDADLRQAEETYHRRQAEAQERYEQDARQAEEKRDRLLAESRTRHENDWNAMASRWNRGTTEAWAVLSAMNEASDRLYPDWDKQDWSAWQPSRDLPPAIRFGEYHVRMEEMPGGMPKDERLRANLPQSFSLPALLPFPDRCSLLLKAAGDGRGPVVQAMQATMLRLLTTLPAGKVRFTIFDPVGLGENFAAFMHLADHDELLVTSRIWTEPAHIDQRLADLTAHMETVIQKYLRNQYATIAEYNAQAGEVAEPFRILVVANFPANFSAEAARRLASIAASGAGCGVYVLVSVDARLPLPDGFHLRDLEQHATCLVWKNTGSEKVPDPFSGRFVWKDDDLGSYPLDVDAPPDAELCTRILKAVGEKAKDASRVEVPFDFIAPVPEEYWTHDSRSGVRVPLGRAGATKRQYLQLGQGTAQHVLIAGKTGSGKSTLLHALITSLGLHYGPDEVELYLVDFKKGVEFKTYATLRLPHARVVAIESEREFGLSVLQRLDAELKQRGDRFRELGVHDLQGARNAKESSSLRAPRILLIVDEFQEFFVEDDKIAQEAALLLDRLVRQGRAFGLHVVLGSQTLGGAYTLARSTIDQMAVRIALQCSEADAHLILSKDNVAARLLTRPGEAIYNDANGLVEGNDFFQVVWLADTRREELLRRVRDLAERHHVPARPQIVFEGNVPADVGKNHLLRELLAASAWPQGPNRGAGRVGRAWLGDAVAIKDPTAAVFRPQTGSHLLLLGQDEPAALAIFLSSLVSLAAQYPPDEVCFHVLDGSPADSPLAGRLAQLGDVLPHAPRVVGWRELPAVLAEVSGEVDRRQKAHEVEGPAIYVFIFGLQRFRDLRRQEDDYGFSRRDEGTVSPDRQLANVLHEGAAVGVHAVLWCDSLNNAQRTLDRQGLRDIEMRVLFQMGVTDSSTLIDSPAASKLGPHRALLHSEDHSQPEKFRPYGLPSPAWLDEVRQALHGRERQDSALSASSPVASAPAAK